MSTMKTFKYFNIDDIDNMTPEELENGYTTLVYAFDFTVDKSVSASESKYRVYSFSFVTVRFNE